MERRFKQKQGLAKAKEEEDKKQRLRRQSFDKERVLRIAEHKQQTEAILDQQQAAIIRKKQVMEARDVARQAYMEEEKSEAAVASERRRLEFVAKREDAKARSESVLEVRRRNIMAKASDLHHRQRSRAQTDEVGPGRNRSQCPSTRPLAFKNGRPPFTEPDRWSQFGRSSFTRHPKLTQETTVYDEQFGRNRPIRFGRSSLAD